MFYEYVCERGDHEELRIETVRATMAEGPPNSVFCPSGCGPMRRLYTGQSAPAIIQWDSVTYVDRAYEGREDTGMRLSQVRAIVDAQGAERARGRRNNHAYGDRPAARR